MTAEADCFATALPGVDGVWPPPPSTWSYSSLREASECPRRWTLSRATYPGIWERPGYPQRPVLPAVIGNVMHWALETILVSLHGAGCTSITDPRTVAVLRDLGGYSVLLESGIDREVQRLAANPRAAQAVPSLETAMRLRVPEMRQRVQAVVGRATLNPADVGVGDSDATSPRQRGPLGEGTYPEVDLRVDRLRFTGRADLITIVDDECVLTDYKTGAPDADHLAQLRVYALLWSRDANLNPAVALASQLVIAYPTHDDIHDGPTSEELDLLERDLAARIADAEADLSRRPPPARPTAEMCRLCSVRHICEDYWPSEAAAANGPKAAEPGSFVDCELAVLQRNGPRSWLVALEHHGEARGLLRTPTAATTFRQGERLRILGVAYGRDEDTDTAILTLTQTSETFALRVL